LLGHASVCMCCKSRGMGSSKAWVLFRNAGTGAACAGREPPQTEQHMRPSKQGMPVARTHSRDARGPDNTVGYNKQMGPSRGISTA